MSTDSNYSEPQLFAKVQPPAVSNDFTNPNTTDTATGIKPPSCIYIQDHNPSQADTRAKKVRQIRIKRADYSDYPLIDVMTKQQSKVIILDNGMSIMRHKAGLAINVKNNTTPYAMPFSLYYWISEFGDITFNNLRF